MARRWLMFGFGLAWLTATVWFQSAGAQNPAPEEGTKTQALIQSQEYDGAIKTLEDYFLRNPKATTGLLLLVNAYRQKGELDKALTANLKVIQTRALRPQGLFNAAGLHALKGDQDEAFKMLQRLRDTGSYDLDMVKNSADLKSLQA